MTTDASLNCWGAVMGSSSTGELFSDEETQNHINVLELKAILFGLESLARHIRLAYIKILCNSSTAVACINKFGTSHSGKCNTLTKQIWKWAQENENWLSATHIAVIQNTEADLESQKNDVHTKWKLRENMFSNICSQLNTIPKIDFFATRLNTQLRTFVSYRPNPKCIAVNAFLLDWSNLDFYALCLTENIPRQGKRYCHCYRLAILAILSKVNSNVI